jgi:hypothetical protein
MLVMVAGVGQSAAQDVVRLEGTYEIDLDQSLITGDVCLMVQQPSDTLVVVLNSSFTVDRVTGATELPDRIEREPGDVGIRRTFLSGDSLGNRTVCLRYSGGFERYDVAGGLYRASDASNVLAFNGSALRARGISRWHPTIFDSATGLTREAVDFDLEIGCAGCGSIYVNGTSPVMGSRGRFIAGGARELFLLAGDLTLQEIEGVRFIGKSVDPQTGSRFLEEIARIVAFLEEFTGVEFGPLPDIVMLDPVRAPRRGQLWGFLSDPALVLQGMSLAEITAALDGERRSARVTLVGFLAHELAHRYFGWRLGHSSPQRDLFSEPFATFLELKAIRDLAGQADYERRVSDLLSRAARGSSRPPLDLAGADDFADSFYRYTYSTAVLLSLETAIGEDAMRAVIRKLVTSGDENRGEADYQYLRQLVLSSGVDPNELATWEDRCLRRSLAATGCSEPPRPPPAD